MQAERRARVAVARTLLVGELRAEVEAAAQVPARAALEHSLCGAREPALAVVAQHRVHVDRAVGRAVELRTRAHRGADQRVVVVLRGGEQRQREESKQNEPHGGLYSLRRQSSAMAKLALHMRWSAS